jgi:hypothetical protein
MKLVSVWRQTELVLGWGLWRIMRHAQLEHRVGERLGEIGLGQIQGQRIKR